MSQPGGRGIFSSKARDTCHSLPVREKVKCPCAFLCKIDVWFSAAARHAGSWHAAAYTRVARYSARSTFAHAPPPLRCQAPARWQSPDGRRAPSAEFLVRRRRDCERPIWRRREPAIYPESLQIQLQPPIRRSLLPTKSSHGVRAPLCRPVPCGQPDARHPRLVRRDLSDRWPLLVCRDDCAARGPWCRGWWCCR